MKLPCPNCGLLSQVDVCQLAIRSGFIRCHGCLMHIRVASEISSKLTFRGETVRCADCGERSHSIHHCTECSTLFKHYCVVYAENASSYESNEEWSSSHHFTDGLPAHALNLLIKRTGRHRIAASCSVLAILLLLAGAVKFRQNNSERSYPSDYVIAMYGINSGYTLSRKTCMDRLESWQSLPEASKAEQYIDLVTIKTEVDSIQGKLATPPTDLQQAAKNLQKLYGVYSKSNDLAKVENFVPNVYKNSIAMIDAEYIDSLALIKRSLPPPIAAEVNKAGYKYNMNFIK